MRRPRYSGRGDHQLGFCRGEERGGGHPRRRIARHRQAHRHGHRRPQLRGPCQPAASARRDVQPGVSRSHRAAAPRGQPGQADRGHLPVGRPDLRLPVARPRPPAQIHLPGQRRQPDRARGARLCRLGARCRRRRHLPVLPRRHPRRRPLPRGRRQGGPCRKADDRRQGRALRRRAPRRRLAYRRAGPCRRRRRCDLPPSRDHSRRGPRPYGRCRHRLRLLPSAAR